ncbi:MAG: DedA family protein [Proteobacteria bacterium]|nr:MAG: DedA family protein [Pseudomonadota bacterium]
MFETLILKWGYIILGIGTFLEGETILLTAGVMAHKGLLSLPLVILVATLGAFLGDLLWFYIGHRYGNDFIQKRPKIAARAASIQRLLDRFGTFFVLTFRFIYGVRTVSPVILGAIKYPMKKYILLNGIGAVIWGVSFSYIGYGLGAGFKEIVDRHPHVEEAILISLGAGLIFWILSKVRKHRLTEANQSLSEPNA